MPCSAVYQHHMVPHILLQDEKPCADTLTDALVARDMRANAAIVAQSCTVQLLMTSDGASTIKRYRDNCSDMESY